ncbi:hypothetical protein [Paenibacillus taiwanensis]|uniref:hypothetical protein n=1 Tax=Paenibacillus taiwanensis TaxID=401638 RepID=UPI00040670B7|nr:hypothetical protein [Paenibacillus taiwanensis]
MNKPIKCYAFAKSLPWIFPFFNLTDDANFGTLKPNSKELRISLFSLHLGVSVIYILTFGFWRKGVQGAETPFSKGFKFFYKLHISQYKREYSQEKKDDLWSKHDTFLSGKDKSEHIAYKETLMYKMDQVKERNSKTFNKLLAYLAVIAFLVPIYVPPVLQLPELIEKPFWIALCYFYLSVLLLYNLYNFVSLFFGFIKVKSYEQFSYAKVKNSESPERTFINGIYLEYQLRNNENTEDVSLILNIESYVKSILIISLVLLGFHLSVGIFDEQSQIPFLVTSNNQTLHLDLSKSLFAILSDQKTNLQEIESQLLEDKLKRIMFIKTGTTHTDKYKSLLGLIQTYNVHNIDVIEVQEKLHGLSKDGHLVVITERR